MSPLSFEKPTGFVVLKVFSEAAEIVAIRLTSLGT
jgi:hypothetical protein